VIMSLDIQPHPSVDGGKVYPMKAYCCYLRLRDTKTRVCKEMLLKSQMKYKHACHQLKIRQYTSWPLCSLLYLLQEPANAMACGKNL